MIVEFGKTEDGYSAQSSTVKIPSVRYEMVDITVRKPNLASPKPIKLESNKSVLLNTGINKILNNIKDKLNINSKQLVVESTSKKDQNLQIDQSKKIIADALIREMHVSGKA